MARVYFPGGGGRTRPNPPAATMTTTDTATPAYIHVFARIDRTTLAPKTAPSARNSPAQIELETATLITNARYGSSRMPAATVSGTRKPGRGRPKISAHGPQRRDQCS